MSRVPHRTMRSEPVATAHQWLREYLQTVDRTGKLVDEVLTRVGGSPGSSVTFEGHGLGTRRSGSSLTPVG